MPHVFQIFELRRKPAPLLLGRRFAAQRSKLHRYAAGGRSRVRAAGLRGRRRLGLAAGRCRLALRLAGHRIAFTRLAFARGESGIAFPFELLALRVFGSDLVIAFLRGDQLAIAARFTLAVLEQVDAAHHQRQQHQCSHDQADHFSGGGTVGLFIIVSGFQPWKAVIFAQVQILPCFVAHRIYPRYIGPVLWAWRSVTCCRRRPHPSMPVHCE